ncbi:hypothetical protein AMAG_09200 [Allomyces macrogynus ATCC 38327]|uniref:ABC transporter domain-containing protein n=1 Tax=Allomyces macrogynus (strain ATCC 38327) TaxID=578462 RepID=A0A0L0SP37_ALLM3|nr:hypothetical protein AMAG_09200 [Allomyces macrogynus ATCC 38327]|eukprot:KNE64154.1 hypothetical protein AMAG_09200 [Allomyces macrogynus ATCC 38327]
MLSEVATPVSLSRANSVTTLDAAGRRRSMTAGFKGKGKAKAKVTKFIEQIMGSSSSSSSSSSPSSSDAEDSDSDEADADKPVKEHKLISDEEKAQGSVEWKVYATYIAAAGGAIWWAVLLSTLFIPQFLNVAQDWWLKTWAQAYTRTGVYVTYALPSAITTAFAMDPSTSDVDVDYYLLVYLGLSTLNIAVQWFQNMLEMSRSMAASTKLHDVLLERVLGAPISWFDSRLESVTRSPIYSTYQETASGTSVIRAFHKEAQFLARAHDRMDVHHRAFYWLWVCNRWLSIRIDFCSNVTVLACGVVILLTGNMYAEAQGGAKPSVVQWPSRGALKVDNLIMQYPSSTTPVLHGISFELNPREKCGVVGRTGAGKSSLALALLRMIEPQSGSVEIDGSRLSDMDLTVLRSRVTMVPQDPVLFEGTIRSNLDVLDEYRYVANYYLASSRELKRLESVTRSPIYSTYQETASGTSVIRAFHKEAQFLARAHDRMDVHHRAFYWLWVCNRWLSIRIDFCSNVTVLACGVVILLTGNMYAGTAGLALSWAMTVSDSCLWVLSDSCLWFVRIFASMEMNMNAIERAIEYSTIEQEAQGGAKPSVVQWPSRGGLKEAQFLARAHDRMDVHHRAFYWLWVCNRWLSIRIDFCSNVTVLACGVVILLTGNMYAGTAGLALSWAMTVSDSCLWFVRIFASMEMNMNAIERAIEYSTIEQEAQGGAKPSVVQWPSRGALKVDNLIMQYPSSTTPVLHGISFELNPREKCGVVGRTGAGKSSLALALLRMIEPQSGSVEIDGSRLSDMDLTVLRSRVTMVPQDPVLFEGTIRSNLDVLDEFDDATCLNALERVHFFESTQQAADPLDAAAAKDGDATATHTSTWTLDSKVEANGKNLSVGQRQLLALARALVRRSKVIIMDESTANVSHDLDAKIQQTVRSEFAESTILCIAHRLRTIADFDKVLVLDHGRVVEFGSPAELIANTEGTFHHMCRESGEFEYLYALATHGTAPSSTVASAAASVLSTAG